MQEPKDSVQGCHNSTECNLKNVTHNENNSGEPESTPTVLQPGAFPVTGIDAARYLSYSGHHGGIGSPSFSVQEHANSYSAGRTRSINCCNLNGAVVPTAVDAFSCEESLQGTAATSISRDTNETPVATALPAKARLGSSHICSTKVLSVAGIFLVFSGLIFGLLVLTDHGGLLCTSDIDSSRPMYPMDRYERLRNVILNAETTIFGNDEASFFAMNLDDSIQHRALSWLAYSDQMQLPDEADEDSVNRIVQRYVMAVLFYSLGWDGFESKNESECLWRGDNEEEENGNLQPLIVPPEAGYSVDDDDSICCSGAETLPGEPGCGLHIQCDETNQVVLGISLNLTCATGATFPREMGLLQWLSHLDLSILPFGHCDLSDASSFIAELSSLEYLRVQAMEDDSGGYSSYMDKSMLGQLALGSMTRLNHLELSGGLYYDNIPDGTIPTEIGKWSDNLSHLSLVRASIRGTIPSELGRLRNLSHLSIRGNPIDGSIPSQLGSLHNLKRLELSSNPFLYGSIPASLFGLTGLQHVSLDRNALTGPISTSVGSLQELVVLNLSQNALSGTIPDQVGDVETICNQNNESIVSFIDFSNNAFMGAIPSSFGLLTCLDSLSLSHNMLEGPIPAGLGRMSQLKRLDLSHNRLTGRVPLELENNSILDLDVTGNTGISEKGNVSGYAVEAAASLFP